MNAIDTRHSLTNALDGPQFLTNTAPAIAEGDRGLAFRAGGQREDRREQTGTE